MHWWYGQKANMGWIKMRELGCMPCLINLCLQPHKLTHKFWLFQAQHHLFFLSPFAPLVCQGDCMSPIPVHWFHTIWFSIEMKWASFSNLKLKKWQTIKNAWNFSLCGLTHFDAMEDLHSICFNSTPHNTINFCRNFFSGFHYLFAGHLQI